MKTIQIIEMEESHVAAVADLEKICFSDPWSENSVAGELKNPLSYWLVAMDGGMLAGYIGSQSAGGESDIMNVAVKPEYRGRGIAVRLIDALTAELRRRGMEAITLEVRESNLPAIQLYEKLCFKAVGLRPNYYFHPRENAIIMRKELKET